MSFIYPVSSILQRTSASPTATALGLGLATTSFFFFGNLANQTIGVAPVAIDHKHRANAGLTTKKALDLWAWSYKRGAKFMGLSSGIGSLSVLLAALRITSVTANTVPLTRNFLLGLATVVFFPAAWTFGLMMPINSRLLSISAQTNASASAKDAGLNSAQEIEVNDLLEKWQKLHYVRIVVGAFGWLGSLAAFTLVI